MLHGTNSKISDVSPCTDLTDLDIFHVTARSVRLAVAFVSYSEITESSKLKEADLLDATTCLYKLGRQGLPSLEFHLETRENGNINR